MNQKKVLFIGKKDDSFSKTAADHLQLHFSNAEIVFSKRSEPFPGHLLNWRGDILISYLSQWIIPAAVLQNAGTAAINLHPGPPEYPGIGCTNFAIYNNEKSFGITCHHMLAKVDSGTIIATRRFPVWENDTVYSITQRCYTEILHLFFELVDILINGGNLPISQEVWSRKAYTRKQLNELCELTSDMNEDEKNRRIRATTYGSKVWAHFVNKEKKA